MGFKMEASVFNGDRRLIGQRLQKLLIVKGEMTRSQTLYIKHTNNMIPHLHWCSEPNMARWICRIRKCGLKPIIRYIDYLPAVVAEDFVTTLIIQR